MRRGPGESREDGGGEQLPLFEAGTPGGARAASRPNPFAERVERERAEAAGIAARIPANVRFGTSSWSFPGWAGIVYPRLPTATEPAREGLADYARHPLLRTVGIERGFYAPIPAEDLRRYSDQLPDGFLCCAKAPEAVTGVVTASASGAASRSARAANPDFLSVRRFEEDMLGRFREVFADHTGPFLLQFPPAPAPQASARASSRRGSTGS